MSQSETNEVHATVQTTAVRRIFAFGVLLGLGGLVIYTALVQPPSPVWLVFMLAFGVTMLWLAETMRRSTLWVIELTDTELRATNGFVLARMDEIVAVDRGAFAFKPSNGFTLKLKNQKPRAWAPGLWWRFGRRVGVGGVTSAGQAKFMAEQIALRITAARL
ncbi:hypothetical protein DS901_04285 [Loktanella sp. D2R18]|uniref:hypothetical protein n=1 Tax=Rhodobacterales TaxID=204455 RepID=UPI000DEB7143|nr:MULTISPECIES: hypothetical protein [Rhodobacterales]MDO6589125.1 hypothetical protein [Yoonia sp. 1_MG-2023]RBW45444.1 hypothetical protein DS901_04285 [Loktanella sp. D2R18]